MRIATLTQEVRQPIRHVNQMASGGSYVAMFTLRLTPAQDAPDIEFSNEVTQPALEPWIVAAIRKGIEEFVGEYRSEGKHVGRLRIALVEIRVHPIDSKESAFALAAYKAMKQAFQAHEAILELEPDRPGTLPKGE